MKSADNCIVSGSVAPGWFSSGGLLTSYGWKPVPLVSFVQLALAATALLLMTKRRRRLA